MKYCAGCKIEMFIIGNERPCRLKRRKYCCKECYHKYGDHARNVKDFSGTVVNDISVIKKDGPKTYLCKCYCGKEFSTRYNRLLHGTTRSCGCYRSEHLRKNRRTLRGSEHPSWKESLTEEDRDKERSREARTVWRNGVFVRDNYKCVVCRLGGKIQAHHLDGWHWCRERRLDTTNGVTLCNGCHRDFHKIYGNSNNTSEEFFEFFIVRTSSRRQV